MLENDFLPFFVRTLLERGLYLWTNFRGVEDFIIYFEPTSFIFIPNPMTNAFLTVVNLFHNFGFFQAFNVFDRELRSNRVLNNDYIVVVLLDLPLHLLKSG